MSNKTRDYEEPLDDSSEAEVEEEFQFDLARARPNVMPRGVRKVQVTLFLDDDVVAHFKQRAAQTPATTYQNQINQALRTAMQLTPLPEQAVATLLDNPGFLKLLDERIDAVVTHRQLAA